MPIKSISQLKQIENKRKQKRKNPKIKQADDSRNRHLNERFI